MSTIRSENKGTVPVSNEDYTKALLAILRAIAVGDSLGLAFEGRKRASILAQHGSQITEFYPISDIPYYPGKHPAGTISDDTLLTISSLQALTKEFCMDTLANCLIEAYEDAFRRYPGDGHPLGWGFSVGEAVHRLKNGVHWSDSGSSPLPNRGFGNGALIRIAPLALYLWKHGATLPLSSKEKRIIRNFTILTHATETAILASEAYVTALLYCLINSPESFCPHECALQIETCLQSSSLDKNDTLYQRLAMLRHSEELLNLIEACCASDAPSHVAQSLPMVLSHFLLNFHTADCLYSLVAYGEDADSNGSMIGALYAALSKNTECYTHLYDKLIEHDMLDATFKECMSISTG